ncbi:MAG: GNAT family N-acetyltransferase [Acidobacteriota bacterium]|jgi:ribosomal protein S18 acetylase RimI-like enzyme|nr:GNAT family N-acetyltransferase [Acidobacteriota bacterium]
MHSETMTGAAARKAELVDSIDSASLINLINLVRPLRRGDRPALARLVAAVENFNEAERECAMELADIYLDDLDKGVRGDYRFAAVALSSCTSDVGDTGDLAGYACWGPVPLTKGTFDLYWIAAHPATRRLGTGRALVAHVEGEVRREGGWLLVAETSAKESYQGTITFYRRLDFQEVSHIRDFYDIGDDRLIFIKRLHTDL